MSDLPPLFPDSSSSGTVRTAGTAAPSETASPSEEAPPPRLQLRPTVPNSASIPFPVPFPIPNPNLNSHPHPNTPPSVVPGSGTVGLRFSSIPVVPVRVPIPVPVSLNADSRPRPRHRHRLSIELDGVPGAGTRVRRMTGMSSFSPCPEGGIPGLTPTPGANANVRSSESQSSAGHGHSVSISEAEGNIGGSSIRGRGRRGRGSARKGRGSSGGRRRRNKRNRRKKRKRDRKKREEGQEGETKKRKHRKKKKKKRFDPSTPPTVVVEDIEDGEVRSPKSVIVKKFVDAIRDIQRRVELTYYSRRVRIDAEIAKAEEKLRTQEHNERNRNFLRCSKYEIPLFPFRVSIADQKRLGSAGNGSDKTTADGLRKEMSLPETELVPTLERHLFQHQLNGVMFLWRNLMMESEGAIIADFMGLGKSLTVISFLHLRRSVLMKTGRARSPRPIGVLSPSPLPGPASGGFAPRKKRLIMGKPQLTEHQNTLIVCPKVVLKHWVSEFDRFRVWVQSSSSLIKPDQYLVRPSCILAGGAPSVRQRIEIISSWAAECRALRPNTPVLSGGVGGQVLIMSYGMLRSISKCPNQIIQSALFGCEGLLLVLDEGHRIRRVSGISRILSKFVTKRRIILTGYPLQNNLVEYWHLISYMIPSYLSTLSSFRRHIAKPIMESLRAGVSKSPGAEGVPNRFQHCDVLTSIVGRMLRPYVLRRGIGLLDHCLPITKTEIIIHVRMTPLQATLYNRTIDHIAERRRSDEMANLSLFWAFCFLTNICNHPKIVRDFYLKERIESEEEHGMSSVELEIIRDALSLDSPDLDAEVDDLHASNKIVLLFHILLSAQRVNDKCVVFTKSIPTIDFLCSLLSQYNQTPRGPPLRFLSMTGKMTASRRQDIIETFNYGVRRHRLDILLVSTLSGCEGINLFAANRVIMLDVNWNPSHDVEATSRVYRFGQMKEVKIYRLVSSGTIEEGVHRRQLQKRALLGMVVDASQVLSAVMRGDDLLQKIDIPSPAVPIVRAEIPDLDDVVMDEFIRNLCLQSIVSVTRDRQMLSMTDRPWNGTIAFESKVRDTLRSLQELGFFHRASSPNLLTLVDDDVDSMAGRGPAVEMFGLFQDSESVSESSATVAASASAAASDASTNPSSNHLASSSASRPASVSTPSFGDPNSRPAATHSDPDSEGASPLSGRPKLGRSSKPRPPPLVIAPRPPTDVVEVTSSVAKPTPSTSSSSVGLPAKSLLRAELSTRRSRLAALRKKKKDMAREKEAVRAREAASRPDRGGWRGGTRPRRGSGRGRRSRKRRRDWVDPKPDPKRRRLETTERTDPKYQGQRQPPKPE